MNEKQARANFPGIVSIIETANDFPTAINLSGVNLWTPPVVYFKHDEIDGVQYDLYCFFWIKDLHHQYDFTGFIQRYSGVGSLCYARKHWDFVMSGAPIYYSAGDHNPTEILPMSDHHFVVGSGAQFVDMTSHGFKAAALPIFVGGAVTPPWDWMSPKIRKAGLIWHDPAEFFAQMEK